MHGAGCTFCIEHVTQFALFLSCCMSDVHIGSKPTKGAFKFNTGERLQFKKKCSENVHLCVKERSGMFQAKLVVER